MTGVRALIFLSEFMAIWPLSHESVKRSDCLDGMLFTKSQRLSADTYCTTGAFPEPPLSGQITWCITPGTGSQKRGRMVPEKETGGSHVTPP